MRVALLLLLCSLQGCLTFPGDKLAEIWPPAAIGTHSFETRFVAFEFELDGGALGSSASMAEMVNRKIMQTWVRQGYASSCVHRGESPSTGTADYTLTLSGNLDGESSVILQFISGLTLLCIPHTIHAHGYFAFELKRERDGAVFKANVAEAVTQITWLPLILCVPWKNSGIDTAMDKVALHLYQRFAAQGAFEATWFNMPKKPTGAPSAAADR